MSESKDEQAIQRFLRGRVAEIEQLSWQQLDEYGTRTEEFTAPSGTRYRIRTQAFWDAEQWGSGMEIGAYAYAPNGWRRRWAYKAWGTRGGPTDPVPAAPAGWTRRRWWQRRRPAAR